MTVEPTTVMSNGKEFHCFNASDYKYMYMAGTEAAAEANAIEHSVAMNGWRRARHVEHEHVHVRHDAHGLRQLVQRPNDADVVVVAVAVERARRDDDRARARRVRPRRVRGENSACDISTVSVSFIHMSIHVLFHSFICLYMFIPCAR